MRRFSAMARVLTGASLALALLGASPATASTPSTGGASDATVTTTPAVQATVPSGGSSAPAVAAYSLRKLTSGVTRPTVGLLRIPTSVTAGKTPAITLRIRERGVRHVTARIVILTSPRGDPVARISLGRIRTNINIRVRWPKSLVLAAGAYVVRVHAKDPRNHVLQRTARAAGLSAMNVTPAVTAPGATAVGGSTTPGSTVGTIPVTTTGVFPVQGPHTYGDGLGAPRNGHTHQGQDILGVEGTPIVAPLPGTIVKTDYQAAAAGYYVVMQAVDGRSFFFAHCEKDSFGVATGQVVLAGASICRMGRTGDASASHLHFEIWENGWRTSAASHFVDPMPQLAAWDHL